MKKILKILGIALGATLLIIIIAGITIGMNKIPSYPIQPVDFQASGKPQAVERGKKLSQMLCANCHMDRSSGKLTGKRMSDAPAEFGEIFSANITQDKEYGIGDWTDGEIVFLLRTGIKKNGQYAPPYMAKLPHLADGDLDAIISFLRSDDRMVVAEHKPDIPTKPSFLTKVLCRIAFKPFPMPSASIAMPDTTNTIMLGEYLAYNLECFSCHSADFKSNDYLTPSQSVGYFAGGNMPLDLEGRVKYTPNLTPDKETGIGNWSKDQFVRAVKYGMKDDGPALSYPMMPYIQLSDYEVGAIFDYLQTIPAIQNKVERAVYD